MSTSNDVMIGVGSGIGVVIAVGVAFAMSQASVRESLGNAFGMFFFSVTNFIPFAFITFGMIADIVAQEFRYTLVSVTGFVAILINWLLKFFTEPAFGISMSGGGEQGWCFIPGLEAFESKATPMNIVSSGAIITYLLIFATLNRQPGQNISLILSLPIMFCLQLATFYFGGCDPYYPSGIYGKLLAILIGVSVGSGMYGVVNAFAPQLSPFSRYWAGTQAPTSGLQSSGSTGVPNGVGAPSTGGKCSAANTDDDNAYVCEAYKNGQLVTETIS